MADNTPFTVKNGFKVGTVDVIDSAGSWTGPGTNITGFQGNQGLAGAQGNPGASGDAGAPGVGGRQGFQGNVGATGPAGAQGPQGTQGVAGVQGAQGTAPVGAQGNQGVVGAQGNIGATGNPGTPGVPGAQGRAGFQGNQGPVGAQGAQGVQGAQGNVGAQGAQGNQGAPGNQGPQGAQGNAGPAGFQGPAGPAGNQGGAGPTGRNGFQGRSGFQGVPGFQGNQGGVGPTGNVGNPGPAGVQGFTGYTGGTPSYNYVLSGGVTRDATNINNYYKTSGTNGGWDGQVYASTGYTSGAYVSFKRNDNLNYVMMGLNSDPATDASYASIDYAWYPYYGGGVQIYENGSFIGEFFGTYNSGTRFLITYDNMYLRYFINEVLYREVGPISSGQTFYMDSSFYYVSASSGFFDVGYGAFSNLPARGPQGVQGVQGPAGFQGITVIGASGNPGAQGPQGAPGPQGIQAPQGLPADTISARGPQGPTGASGVTGPQGPQGPASAVTGVQGFQGTNGGGFGNLSFYVTQRAAFGESTFGTAPTAYNTVPAGSMFSTGAVTQNYSDERLKTNIAPIDNAVTKITALRGIEYNWNELGKEFGWQSKAREVGLIAQDVQKILPEAVEPFINVDGTDYFTLHYTKIIPLAVESIKEQQQQIFRVIDKMKNKNLFVQPIDSTKFNYRTEL